jgi:hypothetical protein
MLFILASWGMWYCAIAGIGKLLLCAAEKFYKKTCSSPAGGLSVFDFFWLGFTFLVAFAGLLQVFYPLDGTVLAICFAAGFAGCFLGTVNQLKKHNVGRYLKSANYLFFSYPDFRPFILIHYIKQKWQGMNLAIARTFDGLFGQGKHLRNFYFIMLSLMIATVSLSCMNSDGTLPFSSDTGSYHLSVVRWINEYATVPGLANLHTRLGYGTASSFFTFAALFDNWIWDGRSSWLVVSFFLLVVLSQILHGLLLSKTVRVKIYSAVCFPYLLLELLLYRPGLYFDSSVFYALVAAGFYIVNMTGGNMKFGEIAEKKYFAFYIVPSIVMFAFTVKPMAVVVLLFCAIVYGTLLLRAIGGDRRHLLKIMIASLAPLLLLSGYLSRNYLTSGWPLFPAPYGGITAQWALPRESVENEYRVIKNWAKAPGAGFVETENESFYEWSSSWLSRNFNAFDGVTFFIPFLLASMMMLRRLTQKKRLDFDAMMFCVFFLSLVFWFFSGPDIRFARGFVWLLLAFSILALYGGSDEGEVFPLFCDFILRHAPKIIVTLVLIEEILLFSVVFPYRKFEFSLWRVGKAVSRPVKPVALNNGQTPPLVVWVPESSGSCGDAPLPCTYYIDDRLSLFVPGNLAQGFYLKHE